MVDSIPSEDIKEDSNNKKKGFLWIKIGGIAFLVVLFICLISFQNVFVPEKVKVLGGGGGVLAVVNPFDQDLNTFNSPSFNTVSCVVPSLSCINSSLFVNNSALSVSSVNFSQFCNVSNIPVVNFSQFCNQSNLQDLNFSLNITFLGNSLNSVNSTSNVQSLGFSTTVQSALLYYSISNPSNFISDGNTNWDNIYSFITSESDPIALPYVQNLNTSLTNLLNGKVSKSGDVMTGNLSLPNIKVEFLSNQSGLYTCRNSSDYTLMTRNYSRVLSWCVLS